MIVQEYEQKFIQLEWFTLELCAIEQARTNKFVWGSCFAFKDRLANQQPRTLAEAVAKAFLSEEILH